jgi:hypothetical protein
MLYPPLTFDDVTPHYDLGPISQALRSFASLEGFVRSSSRFPKPEIWAPLTLDQRSTICVIRRSCFLLRKLRTSCFVKLEDFSPLFYRYSNSRVSWDYIYDPHFPSINGYDRFVKLLTLYTS